VTWWAWTILWVLLILGALWVFFLLGRMVWHKASALLAELSAAAERFQVISDRLAELGERTSSATELAVFSDPEELRRARRKAQARRPSVRTATRGGSPVVSWRSSRRSTP